MLKTSLLSTSKRVTQHAIKSESLCSLIVKLLSLGSEGVTQGLIRLSIQFFHKLLIVKYSVVIKICNTAHSQLCMVSLTLKFSF